MKHLRVDVPATSANLGPGFDALGMALDMADIFTVEFDPASDVVEMDEASSARAGVSREDHYTSRAYRAYGQDIGRTLPGASFDLESHIPVGKGLGSSAGAIVAGLAAAAHAAGDKNPQERILRLAARLEGHPDNSTAAILGGVTVAFQDGENVHALNVVNHVSLAVALFVPDQALRTVEARAALPTEVPLQDAVFNLSRSAYLTTALAWGRWEQLARAMRDRLHQPYRAHLMPALDPVVLAALDAGACGAALSGAGPSVIAFGRQDDIARVAAAMEETAHRYDWAGRTVLTYVRSDGFRLADA